MTYHALKTDVVSPEANDVYPQVIGVVGNVFQLDPESAPTDLVTQTVLSTPGLLMSDRLFRLVSEFRVDGEARPVTIEHLGDTYPYVWYAVTDNLERRVAFEESAFAISRPGQPVQQVEFHDRDKFDAVRAELISTLTGELRIERIAFLAGTPTYDMFYLRLTDRMYFTSEELSTRLVDARVTGVQIGVPIEVTFG